MTDASPTRLNNRSLSDEEVQRALPKSESVREVRLGVFVLFGLVSFVIVLFLLTDPATLRGRYIVTTNVENAGGIRRGDPVQMRGVNIGRIHGFEMREDGQVIIRLEVEGQWDIPVDSRTQLGGSGLFGGRTMQVIRGDAAEMVEEGDNLPGMGEVTGDPLSVVAELSDDAEATMARIQELLDSRTIASVRGSAAELDDLLGQLSAMVREQRGSIERLTSSLASTAEDLDGAGPDARRAIARADSTMAVLSEAGRSLDEASAALSNVLGRMDRGEGTLGRLSTDDALYANMNRAAESLAALVDDIRANPNRYINVSIF